MASFLAGLKAATAKAQPPQQDLRETISADARAMQSKLATALVNVAQSADADADLLSLYARYREARGDLHKVLAERASSDAEAGLILHRRDAIVRDIANMPAKSLRGFAAKMDVLRTCGCPALEKVCPLEPDILVLQSLAADSYWLFEAESV